MTNKHHIFLVEDDLSFGSVMKSYLELNDFLVTWVDDGNNALDKFKKANFSICILDVMLPNVDGFTIGKKIREMDANIPVIFLTAKSLKEDVVKGYDIGADDYITKPFDTDVLIYKLKAILKRNSNIKEELTNFIIGKFKFNSKLRIIDCNGKQQKLSPKEAGLLKMLCQNKNELLLRETALTELWGDDGYFTARSMDVYITKLRKYLSSDPSIEIKNLHGSGFMLTIKVGSEQL